MNSIQMSYILNNSQTILLKDFCVEVRNAFTKKLQKALESLKLPLEYLGIFALAASEADKDKKAKVCHAVLDSKPAV